jgi:hypothetical protein
VQVKSEPSPDPAPIAGGRRWRFRLVDDDAVVVHETAAVWDTEDGARRAGELARRTRESAECQAPPDEGPVPVPS